MTDWALPPVIVDGKHVKASALTQSLRTDLNLTMHQLAYKSADQTVSASATLVDDTALQFEHGANELWVVNLKIRFISTVGAQGLAWQLRAADDAQLLFQSWEFEPTGVTQVDFRWNRLGNTSATTQVFSSTNPRVLTIRGLMYTTLAGRFKFRWAQVTAGNTTTVRAGSDIQGFRAGANPGNPGDANNNLVVP